MCVCVYTYYLFLPRVSRAKGGSEGGGAGLAVPWHIAGLRGAADGQGVNAVGVAVTVTAVLLPAAITWSPDEDGAQSVASLWYKKKKKKEKKAETQEHISVYSIGIHTPYITREWKRE